MQFALWTWKTKKGQDQIQEQSQSHYIIHQ